MPENKLFTEFPPVSTSQWEETIRKDLKGADYEKKLVWKTMEGFQVRPYYRAEDVELAGSEAQMPGVYPYLNGYHTAGNSWEVHQDVWVDDPVEANARALDLLNKGVSSLGFCFSTDARAHFINEASFTLLLKNIQLQHIRLNFNAGNRTKDILSLLKSHALAHHIPKESLRGNMFFDLLGNLTRTGNFYESEKADLAALVLAVQKVRKHFSGIRVIPVDGSLFRNAGSGIVQELAFSLSMANEYLAQLAERGVACEDTFRSMHLLFATGSSYFMEIAKLRAARLLFSRLAEGWNLQPEDARLWIHSLNCQWNKTIYDSHVNILRSTTEAMSAILGGTDSLQVEPYDTCFRSADQFSERIARNIQVVLKEEAYFDRVANPASGSYLIENLTNSIASAAWTLFKEIEKEGGYLKSLHSGTIQTRIADTAKERFTNISSKKEILLGTNQFPGFNESVIGNIHQEIVFPRRTYYPSETAPLYQARGAEQFEKLRLRTEKAHLRPKVFLFPIGNLSMRLARVNFSANFFGVAGFEIIDNPGFATVEDGLKAVKSVGADIVVVCSSDEEYAGLVPAIHDGLADVKSSKGKRPLTIVAGAPECMEELKAHGIQHNIHIRSNLISTLESFQKQLGI
jgi:methylmalonyl-CoA mutase